ncbi:MAG: hypothetical protein ACI4NU_10750 [Christensenellales bacterium]
MEGIAPYTQTTARTNVGDGLPDVPQKNSGVIFTRASKVRRTFKKGTLPPANANRQEKNVWDGFRPAG